MENGNGIKQMVIYDVRMDEEADAFVLILVDAEGKVFLPIWIGHFEAAAILFELREVKPPRPFTHDLLKNIIQTLGGKPQRVVITEIKESTFYAIIDILQEERTVHIDSRPSDAIALATRAKIPIFATKEVLDKAGIKLESIMAHDNPEQPELFNEELNKKIEEFKKFLDHITPEDFKE